MGLGVSISVSVPWVLPPSLHTREAGSNQTLTDGQTSPLLSYGNSLAPLIPSHLFLLVVMDEDDSNYLGHTQLKAGDGLESALHGGERQDITKSQIPLAGLAWPPECWKPFNESY